MTLSEDRLNDLAILYIGSDFLKIYQLRQNDRRISAQKARKKLDLAFAAQNVNIKNKLQFFLQFYFIFKLLLLLFSMDP